MFYYATYIMAGKVLNYLNNVESDYIKNLKILFHIFKGREADCDEDEMYNLEKAISQESKVSMKTEIYKDDIDYVKNLCKISSNNEQTKLFSRYIKTVCLFYA